MKISEKVVISAICIVMLYCVHHWFFSGLNKSEYAAWVQGIGSLLAVGAAFLAIYHQRKAALRAESTRALNKLLTVKEMVNSGHEVAELLFKHTEAGHIANWYSHLNDVIDPEKAKFVLGNLKQFPLHTLESPNAIKACQDAIYWLIRLEPFAVSYFDHKDAHHIFEGNYKSQVKYFYKKFCEAKAALQQSIEEYETIHRAI